MKLAALVMIALRISVLAVLAVVHVGPAYAAMDCPPPPPSIAKDIVTDT
jgi:hypothetical protein